MKVSVATAALLFLAGAPAALAQTAQPATQTPPPAPAASAGSDFTRDLNGGPPRPAEYLTPAPVVTPPPTQPSAAPAAAPVTAAPRPAAPAATTTPRPAAPAPSTAAPTPRPAAPTVAPAPRPGAPAPSTAAPSTAAPATAAPRPVSPAPTPAPRAAAPTPAPVAPTPPPPAPGVSTVTVLDAPARASLPFSVELPAGFQIVTGRPGPDFRIYTIRRGEQSFVMVYVGPASQFPIYSGEQVEAGGRTSVVVSDGGQRHAMEHLFQRADAPREVHIWTMSLEGADRALAEQIAQSVDVR